MVIIHVYSPMCKFVLKNLIESKVKQCTLLDFSIAKPNYIDMSIKNMLVDVIVIDNLCVTEFDKNWNQELLDSKNIKRIEFDISEPGKLKELTENIRNLCETSKSRVSCRIDED